MTLPGIISKIGELITGKSAPADTGTAFVIGLADRGPVNKPVLVRSITQYITTFGPRVSWGALYDALDVAFREGLAHAYVVRCVGPAAKTALNKLTDGAANTLEVLASSPGEWGDNIKVEVLAAAAGNFKLHVLFEGKLVENSRELADNAAAIAWAAANSAYITLKDLGGGDPKAEQSVTLAEGADDRANVTAEVITKGLEAFAPDLGPGQVAAPGNTAGAVQMALLAHADAMERIALPDPEDTGDAETLVANAAALRSLTGARQSGLFAAWDVAPGIAAGTTRTVAPSARQLGAMARVDAQTGNPNTAAAGPLGKAQYVTGLSHEFSVADRETLNDAGVNVSIIDEGVPTTYGWRTLADPVTEPGWVALSTARLMISLASGAKRVLKRYLFGQLDEQGKTVARAEGAIVNEVTKPAFEDGALYGETEADACSVTVEQEVSPTDGSVGNLTATLVARPSGFAETIELTVVETNEAV